MIPELKQRILSWANSVMGGRMSSVLGSGEDLSVVNVNSPEETSVFHSGESETNMQGRKVRHGGYIPSNSSDEEEEENTHYHHRRRNGAIVRTSTPKREEKFLIKKRKLNEDPELDSLGYYEPTTWANSNKRPDSLKFSSAIKPEQYLRPSGTTAPLDSPVDVEAFTDSSAGGSNDSSGVMKSLDEKTEGHKKSETTVFFSLDSVMEDVEETISDPFSSSVFMKSGDEKEDKEHDQSLESKSNSSLKSKLSPSPSSIGSVQAEPALYCDSLPIDSLSSSTVKKTPLRSLPCIEMSEETKNYFRELWNDSSADLNNKVPRVKLQSAGSENMEKENSGTTKDGKEKRQLKRRIFGDKTNSNNDGNNNIHNAGIPKKKRK